MKAQRVSLPGNRWHLQHGPIDIVLGADGHPNAVAAAHDAAWQRFRTVLDELVAELPLLRRRVMGPCPLQGVVARRMWWACHPFHAQFITPMAAVAGAVAQELISCYVRDGVTRGWVNNGGDIALHLADGASVRVGLYADLASFDGAALQRAEQGRLNVDGSFTIDAMLPVRGVATSGWRGRSFSLGIADSVTVLARSASQADAAATIVANAVDVSDPRIERRPACELKDDSDLGELPVTVAVPTLGTAAVQQALSAGVVRARALRAAGLIHDAALVCQGWLATLDAEPRPLRPALGGNTGPGLGSVIAKRMQNEPHD